MILFLNLVVPVVYLFFYRLIFGTTQYFVFVNPKERDASKEKFPEVTFEMAQEEVAKKSGFDMSGENKSRGMYRVLLLYQSYSY